MNMCYFQWHITDRCGNGCKHCYMDNYNKADVLLETARKIAADIGNCCEKMNAKAMISLTGGDPLLHPHFREIALAVKEYATWFLVLGNPEHINLRAIQILKEARITEYQLSLDGMQQTHDHIRYRGSFKKTITAAKFLMNAGITVSIMSTVSSVNIDEMVDVMKLVYSLGIKKWTFARFVPKTGSCDLAPARYKKLMEDLFRMHEFIPNAGPFPRKEPLFNALTGLKGTDCLGGCGLGSSALTILPDNTIMACRRVPNSILGYWQDQGDLFKTMVAHPQMRAYRKIGEIKKCGTCPHLKQCRGCRAAALAATGDIFGRDPQCFIGQKTDLK